MIEVAQNEVNKMGAKAMALCVDRTLEIQASQQCRCAASECECFNQNWLRSHLGLIPRPEAGSPQSINDVWRSLHQLPDQARPVILDHQNYGALI